MSSDQDLSPEEKLLKVIQKGGKAPTSDAATVSAPEKKQEPPAARAVPPAEHPVAPAAGKPVASAQKTPAAQTVVPPAKAGAKAASPAVAAAARPAVSPAANAPAFAKPAPAGTKPRVGKLGLPKPAARAEEPASGDKQAADADAGPAAKTAEALLGKSAPEPAPEPVAAMAADAGTAAVALRKESPVSGSAMRTINRTLGTAFLLLTAGLVWEILAAKPVKLEPSAEGPVISLETGRVTAPLGPVQPYLDAVVSNAIMDDPGVAVASTNAAAGPTDWVAEYVEKNLTLDAVALFPDEPGRSFAVVTDRPKNITQYLKTGEEMEVDGGGNQATPRKATLKVTEIKDDSLEFACEGSSITMNAGR